MFTTAIPRQYGRSRWCPTTIGVARAASVATSARASCTASQHRGVHRASARRSDIQECLPFRRAVQQFHQREHGLLQLACRRLPTHRAPCRRLRPPCPVRWGQCLFQECSQRKPYRACPVCLACQACSPGQVCQGCRGCPLCQGWQLCPLHQLHSGCQECRLCLGRRRCRPRLAYPWACRRSRLAALGLRPLCQPVSQRRLHRWDQPPRWPVCPGRRSRRPRTSRCQL
mmetsp:Transcript_136970/g.381849  ORF Transcript_136970/g.381849 Transcript_136970/m.381849 type:complete len:228 (+) Transcript_136970:590-1273(+)